MSPSLLDLTLPPHVSSPWQTWASAGEFYQGLCTQCLAPSPHRSHLPWPPWRRKSRMCKFPKGDTQTQGHWTPVPARVTPSAPRLTRPMARCSNKDF